MDKAYDITLDRRINSSAQLSFSVPNIGGLYSSKFYGGQELNVVNNGKVEFYGKIVSIEINIDKVTVVAYDKLYFNTNTYPTEDSIYGSVLSIIKKLTNMDISGTSNADDIPMEHEINTDKKIIDNIKKLCEIYGYRFFYSAETNVIKITPKVSLYGGNVNKNILYPRVASQYPVPTVTLTKSSVNYDFTRMYNRVRVYNKNGEYIHNDGISQTKYFVSEATPIKATENANLEDIAKSFIKSHRYPKITSSLSVIPSNIDLLDVVYVDDGKYGLSTLPNKITEVIGLKYRLSNKVELEVTLGDIEQSISTVFE